MNSISSIILTYPTLFLWRTLTYTGQHREKTSKLKKGWLYGVLREFGTQDSQPA